MSEITTLFKGEYIQVDMVDETIELTVENNVYSFSESYELLDELQKACAISRKANGMSVLANGDYKNHLPRLIKEIEDRAERNNKKNEDDSGVEVVGGMIVQVDSEPVEWTFDTTHDYLELEDE